MPIALRLRIGVAVLTYADRLSIGVTTDYASAPEAALLAAAVEAAIAELITAVAAVDRSPGGIPSPIHAGKGDRLPAD